MARQDILSVMPQIRARVIISIQKIGNDVLPTNTRNYSNVDQLLGHITVSNPHERSSWTAEITGNEAGTSSSRQQGLSPRGLADSILVVGKMICWILNLLMQV